MPYYHVLLSVEAAPERPRCVLRDLDEKGVQSAFLKHYKSGRSLLCEGEIIPMQTVRKVSVISTSGRLDEALSKANADAEAFRRELNNGSSGLVFLGGVGYGPDDVAIFGIDVTTQFIREAPRREDLGPPVTRILSNPWVVGVGAAVIAAGIAAWLKWN